ncbi:MAG TPA: lysylphosphatidylglycerol synthase domain-containing protein, partial [Polyangiaceae bacterium]|nr:lysylphosphatidylglycerol synthase domain-containing protein [Polyangiaceae bacterium]
MMVEDDARPAARRATPSASPTAAPDVPPGASASASGAAAGPEPAPIAKGRLAWQLGLGLVIAGFFVWVMRAGALPLIPHAEAFADMRWWTAGVYLLGWSLVHVIRAARWQLLLSPIAQVSTRRVFAASFVGFLAILLLPLRAGEVVRPVMVREQGRLSAWAAAGT